LATKSSIQLAAISIFDLVTFGYSIIQYIQASALLPPDIVEYTKGLDPTFIYHESAPYEITITVFMAIFFVIGIYLYRKLLLVFGWTIFKNLGADIAVRSMFCYLICSLLIAVLVLFDE